MTSILPATPGTPTSMSGLSIGTAGDGQSGVGDFGSLLEILPDISGISLVRARPAGDGLAAISAALDAIWVRSAASNVLVQTAPAARFDALGLFGRSGVAAVPAEAVSLGETPPSGNPAGDATDASPYVQQIAQPNDSARIALAADGISAPETIAAEQLFLALEAAPAAVQSGLPEVSQSSAEEGLQEPTLIARRLAGALEGLRGMSQLPHVIAFIEDGRVRVIVRGQDLDDQDPEALQALIEHLLQTHGLQLGGLTVNGNGITPHYQGGMYGRRAG